MHNDQKINILLVDDNQNNLLALKTILTDLGQNLVSALSGEEAIKLLLEQDFAVILLDIQMQSMDGFEAAKSVRECDRSRRAPIIFLSSVSPSDTDLFKAYSLGAVDYIFKPIIPEILKSKVEVFIELFKKTEDVKSLRLAEGKEHELELAQALEALRKSEEEYRLLFEGNPRPMWVYDLETLFFLAVNNAAIRTYGYSRDEFLSMTIKDIRPAEDIPALLDLVSKADRDLITGNEVRHRKKDGSVIDAEIDSHSIVFERKTARFVLANDITEKKRLEAQFLRAQRMESIGILAGGIAHDLNNVLAPILMGTQILHDDLTNERSRRIVSTIEESAQRGADLVRQVLSFARGIEGKRVELSLNHIVVDIEKMVRETFPKTIYIVTRVSKDLQSLSGNAAQLYQVLMNLCVNARDAMPQGGKISIEAENVIIDEQYARMNQEARPGRFVFISVNDTGSGIPPEIINQIFEPFFTTKEVGKGTGLGLSTSMAIVRSHGGFMNVYSEIGKGTAFKIYLPVSVMSQSVQEKVEHALPLYGRGELILVVDDEKSIREITKVTLEAYGYEAIMAEDGTEAVALYAVNKDRIKLVLMDMMMPELDGRATAKILKRIDPDVKMISASGFSSNNKRTDDIGIKAFLPKPYTAERLLETIAKVLNSE